MVVGWKFVFLLCICNSLVLFQTQIFGRPRVLKLPETSGLMAFNIKECTFIIFRWTIFDKARWVDTQHLRSPPRWKQQTAIKFRFFIKQMLQHNTWVFSFTCLVCRFLLGLLFSMHLEAWNSILCFRIMRRFLSFD